MNTKRMQGLIAAPYTPMHADGSLNLEMVAPYVQKLRRDGVKGVFVGGTTGEGLLLSSPERKLLTEAWAPHHTDDFRVLIHVGASSYVQCMDLAGHAAASGVFGIGAMAPPFLPPQEVEPLMEFCRQIARAAPDLPFYFYHIPSISGCRAPMKQFLEVADKEIPSLAGIKFTHNDLMEMQQCMKLANGKFDILHGYDEVLICGLALGAKAAIGSTYNYMAAVYSKLIQAFERRDLQEAREWQYYSVKVVEILLKHQGALSAGKAIMKMVGIDCGPCRLPVKTLPASSLIKLESDLKAIGFFEQI